MISDEMRELVSAYIDEELRDADAARAEEWIKRDPELRREVKAVKTLRRKLRAWDEAEHAARPSPRLLEGALERARELVQASRRQARSRLFAMFFHPLAAAAALLLAVGLGAGLGRAGGAPAGPGTLGAALGGEALEAIAPMDDYALDGPLLDPAPAARPAAPPAGAPFDEVLAHHLENRLVDGEPISDRALALLDEMRRLEEQTVRRREALVKAEPNERRTRAYYDMEVQTALQPYATLAAPYRGLVLVRRRPVPSDLPLVAALPVGVRVASDGVDLLMISTDRLERGQSRLALLGEVYLGGRDGSGRLRFLGASGWIRDVEFLPMVWGDAVKRPLRSSFKLALLDLILGPGARRRLLQADGRDTECRAWIADHYPDLHGGSWRKRIDRRVAQLTAALSENPEATGFVVLSAGRVMGTELFASHDLMAAYAPRLLRGYLVEAGEAGISLEAPAKGGQALSAVTDLLDRLPEQMKMVVEEPFRGTREDWPAGMERVTLRSPAGAVMGHGLLLNARPVQLSIFAR